MLDPLADLEFEPVNRAYDAVFRANRLSLGLVVPLETYATGPVPSMARHLEWVRLAEDLGFGAVWLRDVPFNVPSFGDAGQLYDPFVYLGFLAARTSRIGLGIASIVLPLRHPAHVAKAAASADALSGGRLLLGIASGDRPEEYPAMGVSFADRGRRFRESYAYIRRMADEAPGFDNLFGTLGGGVDMLPKPTAGRLPMLITGGSQQDVDWIAGHGDGWMLYPRNAVIQARIIGDWRARTRAIGRPPMPAMEPLYIDLAEDPETPPEPIHLGLRLGISHLRRYLRVRESLGVNHVALNLRFNRADTDLTLKRLAEAVLPDFPS